MSGQLNEGYFSKSEDNQSLIDGLDLHKLRRVFVKSLPIVLLIIATAVSVAAIAIRYTKDLYESTSVLQIDIKSEAKVLGFKSFEEDINNLAREIEIIKSGLFLEKVAEALNFDVSYYQYGDILFEERYRLSPFEVHQISVAPEMRNRKVDLEIIDEDQFEIKYTVGERQFTDIYSFNDTVATDMLQIVVLPTRNFKESIGNKYFFTINSQASVVKLINKNLKVEPLDFKAKTIEISFKDHNRQKARDIVEAIDTLYLYYTQLEKNKANKQKINFLNEQLSQTEEKLTELENYFENFTIDNKTTNLDANLLRTIQMLEELDSQKYVIQRQLRAFNAMYDHVTKETEFVLDPSNIYFLSPDMKKEQERLNQLCQEKNSLLNSYNENTLAYQKKDQEIIFIKERILQYIQSSKKRLLENLKNLEKSRRNLEADFIELPAKRTEYSKTERYYGLYEDFYLTLMKNKAEFELAQAGTVTDYRILSSASIPQTPISPSKPIYYSIGLVAGLLLSFIFVGVRYLLHNKITTQQDLEQASQAFVLGTVPYHASKEINQSRLVVTKHLKSSISEAFRTIRTNLEFLNGEHKRNVIAITSTVSGEGKTFVATNLAGIIRLLNNRVLLIDLDMRKPRLHEVFDHAHKNKGLSTILIKKHNLEECIQQTEFENLDFLPAGPIPPNPSELVLSSTFTKLMHQLEQQYDVVIVDTPPVGLVTDGIQALKIATMPIYVFRADFSKKTYINNVNHLRKVHKLNNLSLILNSMSNSKVSKYGYGKGYYEDEGPRSGRKLQLKKLLPFRS
jgi:tyrosine-protein kinase Etk/Wzc